MIRGAADGARFQVWDYEEGEVEALLDQYFAAAEPEPHPVKKQVLEPELQDRGEAACLAGSLPGLIPGTP